MVILALAVVRASPAPAKAAEVVVRTQVNETGGIVVGQPVHLRVDVLFPGSMPRPPRVKVGDVPGAQVLRFETQGVTTNDQINGQPYVGQQFEFVVFPRRGGAIDIPAAEVTLLDAAGDRTGTASGEARRIVVTVPPGLDPSGPVIAADEVDATQGWEPDPAQARLKPGGALVRTIRRSVDGVPAMGMADLAFTAPEGVRIYVDPPRSEDRVNRGALTGSRLDRVTYVFEEPGSYDLPSVVQPWWDLDEARARAVTLAGVRVAVTQAASATEPVPRRGRTWVWAAGALLGIALLLGIAAALRRRRVRRVDTSEATARSELRRVARSGDAPATYRALATWLARLPFSVRQRARRDPRLAPLADELERTLFGEGGSWSVDMGRQLRHVVPKVRKDLAKEATGTKRMDLPPLNPAAPASSSRPA
ncbi:BatD family protein [Methylobacterium sp. WSM2598]|uniref:BatD family protein n=1 Tax=Methylobacterium sp. WSM2598 TaxID=398261 RepID=UPI000369582B|nr:BatD family protein [Methylobacterium sp. WSM2598]